MSTSNRSGLASRMPIPANGPASQMLLDGLPITIEADVRARTIEPQGAIFREGEAATSAYRIVTGEVSLVRQAGAPGKVQTLERLGPARYFGELGLLGSGRRTFTALATARTLVLEMDNRGFEAELSTMEEAYRAGVWLLLEFCQAVPPRTAWADGRMPANAHALVGKMAQSLRGLTPELVHIPGAFLRGLYARLVDAALDRFPGD